MLHDNLPFADSAGQGFSPESPRPWHHDQRRELLEMVLSDREWDCDADTRKRMQRMLRVLQAAAAGQFAALARPGEEDWALLAEQLERYLGFRRLRQLEAGLRAYFNGSCPFANEDWGIPRLA